MSSKPAVRNLATELAKELQKTKMFNRVSIERNFETNECTVSVCRRVDIAEFTVRVSITEKDCQNPDFTEQIVCTVKDVMNYKDHVQQQAAEQMISDNIEERNILKAKVASLEQENKLLKDRLGYRRIADAAYEKDDCECMAIFRNRDRLIVTV